MLFIGVSSSADERVMRYGFHRDITLVKLTNRNYYNGLIARNPCGMDQYKKNTCF